MISGDPLAGRDGELATIRRALSVASVYARGCRLTGRIDECAGRWCND